MNSRVGRLASVGLMIFFAVTMEARGVTLSIASAQASPQESVIVLVETSDGKELGGLQFVINYDADLLELERVELDESVGGGLVDQKIYQPGLARVAAVLEKPLSQDGSLLRMHFRVLAETAVEASLDMTGARAWSHKDILELQVETQPGHVTIEPARSMLLWIAVAAGVIVLLLVIGLSLRKKPNPN